MDLSDYALDPVRTGTDFVLSRGTERNPAASRARSLLALAPAPEHPAPELVRRLEHEYSLSAELDEAWAVRPILLVRKDDRITLVLDDPGGQPLERLLTRGTDLGQFLRTAVGLCAALRQLHGRGLIHKDIKPANVLVNPDGCQVRLMGFGIASRLPRERQTPAPPEFIAGTLPYMAPEQTGRMNRSIDSRSDLYSLGVTLYEMLTGSLPFTAVDSMEWVHCHIARRPVPPAERSIGVPAQLSDVVMKLLAKTAEDRSQTAAGLEHDLRRCSAQWEAERRIVEFPLGENDTPERLFIPERLYGREREVETLVASFDRVVKSGTPELILVSGHPGIGKSSVVQELHKVLVPPRGLFASGKFDQYKRDIPYSTLAQAFQSLVRRLLAKSEVELEPWREALREALGPNGQLLVDLVPELKLIIGEQPPIPELPPQDARRRFQAVFRRFIGVFARAEHPLALFLDDLQWLDSATLDALEDLLTQTDVQHLLMIGAYRDNEVDGAHPLVRRLESIRKAGTSISEIKLAPLSPEDVAQLVQDALQSPSEGIRPLAQLIYRKTGGNPFFTTQFLSALEHEGLLGFDHGQGRWSWDIGRIHAKGYTENVVDLMVGKLRRLPAGTQKALQQLACLGNAVDGGTLSIILEMTEEQVQTTLWEGVRQELLEQLDGSYKFIHDRVHEAAYSLIPEMSRAEAHLRIGRLLAAQLPAQRREEMIFEIVNQLNLGAAFIISREEQEQLAELNLASARRAKTSTAHASALKYLKAGAALLGDDPWRGRRDLIFALELERAECEFLTSALASADERLTALSSRATDALERAAIACLHMDVCTNLGQSGRAVAVALDYLRQAGIEWSPHPTEDDARREYEQIWSRLAGRSIEEVIDSPLMTDPESLATVDVLTKLVVPAFFTDRNLDSLAICRAVNLSLEHGNCGASCLAYVTLGRIAGPRFSDYQAALRFGQVACELVERRELKRFQAGTYLYFAAWIARWMKHVRTSSALQRRAFEAANQSGDLTYAAYATVNLNSDLLVAGDPLGVVQHEAELGLAFTEKARFGIVSDVHIAQLAMIRTLRGATPKFGCFDSEQIEELAFERHLAADPTLAIAECWYWVRKLQARYLAGEYKEAIDAASRAEQLLWTSPAFFEEAEYHFYGALSRAAGCDSVSDERSRELETLARHLRQLEIWAQNCPDNFENRAALVAGEIARLEGRDLDAARLYERAIRSAHASGFVQNEAIAYEVAARFYAARGFETIADLYWREASHGYARWGAEGKATQLEQVQRQPRREVEHDRTEAAGAPVEVLGLAPAVKDSYPRLASRESAQDASSTIVAPVEILDLATVVKVSQAISGEMVLERLIDRLLRAAIEHAGAERGLLIVPRSDELHTRAEARTSGDDVIVELRDVVATSDTLPETLIRYVSRTHENVILDDASAQNPFVGDPYVAQKHARSVLCLPLLNQTKAAGFLYLENNLAPGVFAPDRIVVLKVLASQAATALENTQLYRDLENREAKIRRLVDANILAIIMWNVDGAIIGANDAFVRMVQYEHEDVASRRLRWTELTPAEWRESDERALRALRETGTVHPYEKELIRKDGSRVPVLVAGALFEEGGEQGVAFALDLTEQKRAEAEIRELKDQLYRENLVLREEVDRASMFEEIVGASRPLKAVLARIAKVAPTDSTVFISGETGTGKELLARAVHKRSQRSGRAFVSVNCAALAPSLISSELFGHEKGAFTGATQRRPGRFELADGGTIFLDEVGELLPDTQVALLRVLQEREFERVGGVQPIRVDVRVIAATNRDLKAAVASGAFRQDLYYRLNVFPIEVPPLRERKEDILLLVEYFVRRYASRAGKNIRSIDKRTLDLLVSYEWPGNIRELQNVIERSVILSPGEVFAIDELWLPKEPSRPASQGRPSPSFGAEALREREIIEAALSESRGRISGPSGAAAKLQIPPSTLEYRIKALKIRKSEFRFR